MSRLKRLLKKYGKLNKAVIAFVLAVSMILGLTPMFPRAVRKAEAADGNLYALIVYTGATAGTAINSLIVEYEDNTGANRRVYINPQTDYAASLKKAADASYAAGSSASAYNVFNRQKLVADKLGYTADSWSLTNGKIDSVHDFSSVGFLQSNTENTFLFESYNDISKVISIGVMSSGVTADGKIMNNISWDCRGMALYKVSKLTGLGMYGFASTDYYVMFNGSLKAKMITGSPAGMRFNFSKAGTKTIGTGENSTAYLKTSGFAVSESSYSSENVENYMIALDVADSYLAGIEAYVNCSAKKESDSFANFRPAETLVMDVSYTDCSGFVRNVQIPVITSLLGYCMEKNIITDSTVVCDLVSQSNTLAICAGLPAFYRMDNIALYYVNTEDGKTATRTLTGLTGLKSTSAASKSHSEDYALIASENDALSFTGIQVYEESGVKLSLLNKAQIKATVTADPLFYYTVSASEGGVNGFMLNSGSSKSMNLAAYTKGSAIRPKDSRRMFLFQIKTSDYEMAGTTEDIIAVLNYVDSQGKEKSETINFREQCMSYYGFWVDSNRKPVAYSTGMKQNGTLFILKQMDDVEYFTGVSFQNAGEDDWVSSAFSIYLVEKLGPIQCAWQNAESASGTASIRYRSVNGQELIPHKSDVEDLDDTGTEPVEQMDDDKHKMVDIGGEGGSGSGTGEGGSGIYVGGDTEAEVEFNGTKVTRIRDIGINIFEYLYSMDYEIATSNLGFARSEIDYDITVNVGTDVYSPTGNDDCGSANYFYFQLVFENGVSGYVQANQQLESDGFRSGQSDHFTISSNRDYGEVVAINIIPETDPNLGFPYDKLKVDSIEITRTSDSGIGHTSVVNNIGWIGIDYTEQEAKKEAHTAAELAKTFAVTGTESSAKILFTLSTKDYPKTEDNKSYNQFEGSLYATIYYETNDNVVKTERLDVVQKMHEFNGTSGGATISSGGLRISDPTFMFRPCHTDRFIWTAKDIKKIDSVVFDATNLSENPVEWRVGSLGVSLINSGSLKRRSVSNGEYILYDGAYTALTSSEGESDYVFTMNKNQTYSQEISLKEMEGNLLQDTTDNSMPFVVTKAPVSENDTLNIYAYIDSSQTKDVSDYSVRGEVVYTDVYGDARKSSGFFKYDKGTSFGGSNNAVFYYRGLSVKKFNMINYIQMKASGGDDEIPIDYILVQQVRSNVVIATYRCTFNGENNINSSFITPQTSYITSANEAADYQEVTLMFGPETKEATLTPQKYDVAVALRYKPSVGADNDTYITEYVYLTEMGITSIKPGDVVTFKFKETGIKEVLGLVVASTTYLQADVRMATVGAYVSKNGSFVCDKWYSLNSGVVVNNEVKSMQVTSSSRDTSDTVSTLTFNFKTMERFDGIGTNTGISNSDRISMTIYYKNDGVDESVEIENLNDHLESGSFAAGREAVVKLLLQGINYDNITAIKLVPYDNDNTTTLMWGLESVNVAFGDGQSSTDEQTASPEKILYEDGDSNTISFLAGAVWAEVHQCTFNPAAAVGSQYVEGALITKAMPALDGTVNVDYSSQSTYLKVYVDINNLDSAFLIFPDEEGRAAVSIVDIRQKSDLNEGGRPYFVLKVDGIKGSDVSRTIKVAAAENEDCYSCFKINVNYLAPTSMDVVVSEIVGDQSGVVGTISTGGTLNLTRKYSEAGLAFDIACSLGSSDSDYYCEASEGVTLSGSRLIVTGEAKATVTRTVKLISRSNATMFVTINITVESDYVEPEPEPAEQPSETPTPEPGENETSMAV